MDPSTLALMYAANVGINALGGKRGSNLWKDSFKDTSTQALTMQLTGGFDKPGQAPRVSDDLMLKTMSDTTVGTGANKEIIKTGLEEVVKEQPKKALTDYEQWVQDLDLLKEGQKTVSMTPDPKEGWRGWFDKAAGAFKSEQPMIGEGGTATQAMRTPDGKVVRVPITSAQTDKMKVGLASLGAGATAYGLGMFDPIPPPEPKYPGYNKFYAQNPGQFMPYDDPDIAPIDYSKYPDKPYSGIKAGGIISLQDGGSASYKNILQTDYGYERDYLDNLEMNEGPGAVKELYDSLQGKQGGIGFAGGGQTLSAQELFNKVMMEGYRPTPEEQQLITQYLQSQSGQKKGGIMKLARGGRASNEPVKGTPELTDDEERFQPGPQTPRQQQMPQHPRPRMPGQQFMDDDGRQYGPGVGKRPDLEKYGGSENVGSNMPVIHPRMLESLRKSLDYMAVKSGALIHKLPHKTKQNENKEQNYKRTSGKLVVDSKGKGNEEKDTMLAQLADGEFVTKSKAVRGAGIALGADPKNKKQQRDIGARFFYKQMSEFDKLAKRMAS